MKPPIERLKTFSGTRVLLVHGRARQALPVMKSLHNLGCHITTYNSSMLDVGYASRYPNARLIAYCDESDPEGSYAAIRDELRKGGYDLVIPLNDFPAILLSQHKQELSSYASLAVNDWEIFQTGSDKLRTMRMCDESGVPYPRTYLNEDLSGVDGFDFDYPVLVKPRTGYGAIGLHVVDDRQSLRSVVQATANKFGPPLVQEYIPQTDLQYKAELYVANDGTVKSACVFAKYRWYPLNGGSSTLNVTVERPDIVADCEKLLTRMGWKGYADVDLIQDPRDNRAKVMELNPRITAGVKLCYVSGVDFSEQILQDYADLPVSDYRDYAKGRSLRHLHSDILWFCKSRERFSGRPSWFDFRNTSDQIISLDDPLPFVTYSIQSLNKLADDRTRRSLS